MLKERLQQVIDQYHLFSPDDRIIVAVSGGPDSIALLHLLNQIANWRGNHWNVVAAHLNHGFRGKESEEDAEYVQEFCTKYSIPLEVRYFDVPKYMKETGLGAQESAREIRYQFLSQVAEKIKAHKIATAHHADDQIETILMRIIRGTGIDGLIGMPVRRKMGQVEIVRPFLSFYKKELEDYCQQEGLNPRIDKSNLSVKYTRNKVRLQVLPLLREINPQVGDAILQLSEIAGQENNFMEQEANDALKKVIDRKNQRTIIIKRSLFQEFEQSLQRRICKLILSCLFKNRKREWSYSLINEIIQFISSPLPSGTMFLPKEGEVRKKYNQVIFSMDVHPVKQTEYFEHQLNIPGITIVPEAGITIHAFLTEALPEEYKGGISDIGGKTAIFDWNKLTLPLKVRQRSRGDRIRLMGQEGNKKLKDVFIDQKIPREERDFIPIITHGERIIWVPGIKRSGEALVSSSTEKFLIIEVE